VPMQSRPARRSNRFPDSRAGSQRRLLAPTDRAIELKSGRTSPPHLLQAWQTICCSMSDSRRETAVRPGNRPEFGFRRNAFATVAKRAGNDRVLKSVDAEKSNAQIIRSARLLRLLSVLSEPANRHFLWRMQGQPDPICPPCTRCGKQPQFLTSMLDPRAGRIFHMFVCECGDRSWTSDKSDKG
jgi:hypothetical protein